MNIDFFSDLLTGRRDGGTFDSQGLAVTPVKDVVTLVCKTVSRHVTPLEFDILARDFLTPYMSQTGGLYMGFYRMQNGDVSIDVNVLVDIGHRDNTLDFARANGQEAIWDGLNSCLVPTGGNGVSKLSTSPEEVLHAAVLLVRGLKHPIQNL